MDSTIAASLLNTCIGSRFHAVLVDNGVMRLNECAQVKKDLQNGLNINLTVADASELFLSRLEGITDPEKKRKIIGHTFIEVFESEARKIEQELENKKEKGETAGKITFLLQGTLYPDVIESISFKGPSATIKTHHVRITLFWGWLAIVEGMFCQEEFTSRIGKGVAPFYFIFTSCIISYHVLLLFFCRMLEAFYQT